MATSMSIGMLIAGALNTLSIKFQDRFVVAHLQDGTPVTFYHPAVQCACMFLGEFLCVLPYIVQQWRRWVKNLGANSPHSVSCATRSHSIEPLLDLNSQTCRVHYTSAPSFDANVFTRASHVDEAGARGPDGVSQQNIDSVFVLALPTLCDASSSILMNVGLFYTSASVFQMLRGLVVFFAGIFTVLILKRRLHVHHWQGMMLIVVGAAIVGLSSVVDDGTLSPTHHYPPQPPDLPSAVSPDFASPAHRPSIVGTEGSNSTVDRIKSIGALIQHSPAQLFRLTESVSRDHPTHQLIGNMCVMAAQVFAALQYIVEEKYVKHYRIPASVAVGFEGFWGLILSCLLLPLFQNVEVPAGYPIDDARNALLDLCHNETLALALFFTVLTFTLYNWFGLSLTISLSGAARLSIDACRTLLVWSVSIVLGWERFNATQLLGFVIIICGTVLYNELLGPLADASLEPTEQAGGPQYTAMTMQQAQIESFVPYQVSLQFPLNITHPHSPSSMGGPLSSSPGVGWRISPDTELRSHHIIPETPHFDALPAQHLSSNAQMIETPDCQRSAGGEGKRADLKPLKRTPLSAPALTSGRCQTQGPSRLVSLERSGSFYKYDAFYSGMDVGVTPPLSVAVGGSMVPEHPMSATPRPDYGSGRDGSAFSFFSGSLDMPPGPPASLSPLSAHRPQLDTRTAPRNTAAKDTMQYSNRSMLSEQLARSSEVPEVGKPLPVRGSRQTSPLVFVESRCRRSSSCERARRSELSLLSNCLARSSEEDADGLRTRGLSPDHLIFPLQETPQSSGTHNGLDFS